jgi:hypothetical protein
MESFLVPSLPFGLPYTSPFTPLPFATIRAGLPNIGNSSSLMRAIAFEESVARGNKILEGYRLGMMATERAAAAAAASSDEI